LRRRVILDVHVPLFDVKLVDEIHLHNGHSDLWVDYLGDLLLHFSYVDLLRGHFKAQGLFHAIKHCSATGRFTPLFHVDFTVNPEAVLKSIEAEAPRRGFPIIGPKRGEVLDKIVMEHSPSSVLEVGTLVGYSAIRIARHLKPGQKLTCVELSADMASMARSNIENAGLSDRVEVKVGDAKKVLPRLKGPYDMVFLDAAKDEYYAYLKSIEGLLHPGTVVVADNAKLHADAMKEYLDYVRGSGKYASRYEEAPSNYGNDPADAVEVSVKL